LEGQGRSKDNTKLKNKNIANLNKFVKGDEVSPSTGGE